MARTNATNFSGGLQFPYATAGADLFKKEDVQVLAQAVDQHDHTAGKGLVLPASAIPAGFITSAMIADGTITSTDIADGTITSLDLAAGAATFITGVVGGGATATTTSSTLVDIPDLTMTFSTTIGAGYFAWLTVNGWHSIKSGQIAIALNLDGVDTTTRFITSPDINYGVEITMIYFWAPIGTGSHTIKGRWSQTGGTGTLTTSRTIMGVEFRR